MSSSNVVSDGLTEFMVVACGGVAASADEVGDGAHRGASDDVFDESSLSSVG
ncbi:MAG TPA: hypothetical protein VKP65_09465 [Rhodothermales bacterium]|nr:hypothetical protein [Rhodothermales bacterium]